MEKRLGDEHNASWRCYFCCYTGLVTVVSGDIDVFDMCFDVSVDVDLDEILTCLGTIVKRTPRRNPVE